MPVLLLALIGACQRPSRVTRLEARVDSLAVTVTAMNAAFQNGALGGAAARPETLAVDPRPGMALGDSAAPVTIVEFTDFQCPFCGRHATTTLPQLRKEYVDKGLVRYVVRNNPLPMHPFARRAAIAARCAAEQSPAAYWRYHDGLFAGQAALADSTFDALAQADGLDLARFDRCRMDKATAERIDADVAAASKAGFRGTPTFVIGRVQPDGTVRGEAIEGAYPFARFKSAIDGLLHPPAKAGTPDGSPSA